MSDYDKYSLIPKDSFSKIRSRTHVDLYSDFHGIYPLIAAPMRGISGPELVIGMAKNNCIGILHRFADVEKRLENIKKIARETDIFGVSIGAEANGDELAVATAAIGHGAKIICVDIANGYIPQVAELGAILKREVFLNTATMVGNVLTPGGVRYVMDSGYKFVRCSVGSGNLCTTRLATGIGMNALDVMEAASEVKGINLVMDGGIRYPGDAVKSFACGAHFVMMGSALANTEEADNEGHIYGMACYDTETEILTKEGWKFFKDISHRDQFAALNPQTNYLEYQNPVNIYKYPYKGDMIKIESNYIDLLVTPNHNLYIAKQAREGYTHKFRKMQAQKVFDNKSGVLLFKQSCKWKGTELNTFELPLSPYVFDIDDWLWLFGFWTAEGNSRLFFVGDYLCYSTTLSNNDKSLIDKASHILDKYGIEYHVRARKSKFNDNVNYELRTSDQYLTRYLNKFGKALNKYVPRYIKDLSKEKIQIYLSGFNDGDGAKSKNAFYTSSLKLKDDLMELLIKAGFATFSYVKNKKGSTYKDFKRNADGHCISFRHSNFSVTTHLNYSKTNYSDFVWCVEVPNGLVLVRRNGRTCWCGNSSINHVENGKEIKSIEGREMSLNLKERRPLKSVLDEFLWGIRSACTYLNCTSYKEIREQAIKVRT